jgi:hypothetical protein
MIDWVIPPQTAVALYIYRVGRSCPARNPFTTQNLQRFLNSTRTRGLPVRPTGQTGVAIARSATRRPTGQTIAGHRSDRLALCQIWVRTGRMFVFLEMEIYLASTIYAHSQILTCNQQENSKGTKNTVGRENNLKQYLIILLINPFLKKNSKHLLLLLE